MTISDIARATSLSKSTAFNILRSLVDHGLVVKDEHPPLYRIGPKVVPWASAFMRSLDGRRLMQDQLDSLRDQVGETVTLHIRSGSMRVCLAHSPSLQSLRRVVEVGSQRPLFSGAAGQVLLGALDDDELEAFLDTVVLVALTPNAVVNRATLVGKVERARRRGYAIGVETTELGVSSIAVPVRGSDSKITAALAVSGPATRWTARAMLSQRSPIVAAAEAMGRTLGDTEHSPVG